MWQSPLHNRLRFRLIPSQDPGHPFTGFLCPTSDWQAAHSTGALQAEVAYWLAGAAA
jgi:hypothetical protein